MIWVFKVAWSMMPVAFKALHVAHPCQHQQQQRHVTGHVSTRACPECPPIPYRKTGEGQALSYQAQQSCRVGIQVLPLCPFKEAISKTG